MKLFNFLILHLLHEKKTFPKHYVFSATGDGKSRTIFKSTDFSRQSCC